MGFRSAAPKTKTLVDIDVFRCCSVGGDYFGGLSVHDPDLPGDGPWFVRILKEGVDITFGFGTKAEALATVDGLTRFAEEVYEIEIDPTED